MDIVELILVHIHAYAENILHYFFSKGKYVSVHAYIAGQVELRFGDRDVRNNSYILRGDIPGDDYYVNTLLCASDTTNPATRQWYDRDGDALGTTQPSNGAYQAIDSVSGGVLLYIAGNIDTGLHYCRISDSSGNIQTLYAGLYTSSGSGQSGRANGENMCGTPARATQLTALQLCLTCQVRNIGIKLVSLFFTQ